MRGLDECFHVISDNDDGTTTRTRQKVIERRRTSLFHSLKMEMLSFYDNWNLSFLLLSPGRGPGRPEEEEGKVRAVREEARRGEDESIKIKMNVCPAGRTGGARATLTRIGVGVGVGETGVGVGETSVGVGVGETSVGVGVGVGVGETSVEGELAVKRVTARTAEEDRLLWIEAKIQSQLLPRSHITQIVGHKKQGQSGNHFFAFPR